MTAEERRKCRDTRTLTMAREDAIGMAHSLTGYPDGAPMSHPRDFGLVVAYVEWSAESVCVVSPDGDVLLPSPNVVMTVYYQPRPSWRDLPSQL